MVQQDDSPSTLGAYGVRLRVQQRPPQYAARGRTVLAHRRGYSGRRLLTQVSPVALVFTTKRGRPATPAPAAALAGAALSFSYFLSTSMGFRLSPFGAPVFRRTTCHSCQRRAQETQPVATRVHLHGYGKVRRVTAIFLWACIISAARRPPWPRPVV